MITIIIFPLLDLSDTSTNIRIDPTRGVPLIFDPICTSWKSSPFSPTQLNGGEFHSCRDLAGGLLELCSEAIEKPSQSRYSLQSQQPVWIIARGDSNFTRADAMRTVVNTGSLLFLLIHAKWLQMVAKPPNYSQGSIGPEIKSCPNRISPCVETAEAQYLCIIILQLVSLWKLLIGSGE